MFRTWTTIVLIKSTRSLLNNRFEDEDNHLLTFNDP